jgi:hypothetical protein
MSASNKSQPYSRRARILREEHIARGVIRHHRYTGEENPVVEILEVLKQRIRSAKAVEAAHEALRAAIEAEKETFASTDEVVERFRARLVRRFAADAQRLADYGLVPPRPRGRPRKGTAVKEPDEPDVYDDDDEPPTARRPFA